MYVMQYVADEGIAPLQVWCMLLNDKVQFRMHWPQNADLQVNGTAFAFQLSSTVQISDMISYMIHEVLLLCTRTHSSVIFILQSRSRHIVPSKEALKSCCSSLVSSSEFINLYFEVFICSFIILYTVCRYVQ